MKKKLIASNPRELLDEALTEELKTLLILSNALKVHKAYFDQLSALSLSKESVENPTRKNEKEINSRPANKEVDLSNDSIINEITKNVPQIRALVKGIDHDPVKGEN